jgi:predicted RNA-binding Zn-ribbon protein involved in translation (DUF1610 family)
VGGFRKKRETNERSFVIYTDNTSSGICAICGWIVWVRETDTTHDCAECKRTHGITRVDRMPDWVKDNRTAQLERGDEYLDQEFACNVAEDLDNGFTHSWRVAEIREAMRDDKLADYVANAREVSSCVF